MQDNIQGFKRTINDGKKWEQRVDAALSQIRHLTNDTCPKFLANPNGDSALKEFTAELQRATGAAAAIEKQAADTTTFLDKNSADGKRFLLQFGLSFDSAPCGKGIKAVEGRIQDRKVEIANGFARLQTACPSIAQSIPTGYLELSRANLQRRAGEKTAPRAGGKSKPDTSDVTGAAEDLKREKAAGH